MAFRRGLQGSTDTRSLARGRAENCVRISVNPKQSHTPLPVPGWSVSPTPSPAWPPPSRTRKHRIGLQSGRSLGKVKRRNAHSQIASRCSDSRHCAAIRFPINHQDPFPYRDYKLDLFYAPLYTVAQSRTWNLKSGFVRGEGRAIFSPKEYWAAPATSITGNAHTDRARRPHSFPFSYWVRVFVLSAQQSTPACVAEATEAYPLGVLEAASAKAKVGAALVSPERVHGRPWASLRVCLCPHLLRKTPGTLDWDPP